MSDGRHEAGEKEQRTDDEYLEALETAPIAKATRMTYIHSIKRVQAIVSAAKGRDVGISWILRHAGRSWKYLEAGLTSKQRRSLKTLVASVLAVIKHAGVKNRHRDIFYKWYDIYKPLEQEIDTDDKAGHANGRQLLGATTWHAVLKAREALAKEDFAGREHLLFSIFTYLAPRRQQDYFRVRVVTQRPYPRKLVELPAYLDLTIQPPRLTINQYKTAKKYNAWKKDLTDTELLHIIHTSLEREPREYLFVQSNGEPFSTPHAFTVFSNRTLKKYLGPHVTVNSLRHAATKASLTDPKHSYQQQEDYAKDMGHSFDMHRRYNKVIPD